MTTQVAPDQGEPAASAASASAGIPVVTHDARDRMQRMLFLATGIGAIVFGALLATGGGGILAQMSQLRPAYAWGAVAVVILLPATFVVLPFVISLRAMYALAATASVGFVVAELLWVPSMTVDVLANDASPWLQGVTALAATITAVRWQGRWVWAYAIATGPIVAVNQILSRADSTLDAILDGLGGMVFSLILMGVATAVVHAAERQDQVAARARAQASLEASRRTRDREQTRINAIVHDDVMSVLLTAGRKGAAPGLAEQAQRALAAIAAITQDGTGRTTYSPEEFTAALRATVTGIIADVDFSYRLQTTESAPASVVAAMTEALAEAIRNSAQYAGHGDEAVSREVHIDVTETGAAVRIRDSGRGFAPKSVGPRRLGIRVSIIERMRSISGGDAAVTSRPGAGTTVDLSWRRP
ncbi:sensor histidine kinase [Demequina oxidasica]|uniref:sensor histidine kinase n=1 Tax=Demequina oxidasica TaxID=676199 RepID=UPI0007816C63|nr:ATP-binding protein [Demequina oxidasica]